jgi:hypothetical protein
MPSGKGIPFASSPKQIATVTQMAVIKSNKLSTTATLNILSCWRKQVPKPGRKSLRKCFGSITCAGLTARWRQTGLQSGTPAGSKSGLWPRAQRNGIVYALMQFNAESDNIGC